MHCAVAAADDKAVNSIRYRLQGLPSEVATVARDPQVGVDRLGSPPNLIKMMPGAATAGGRIEQKAKHCVDSTAAAHAPERPYPITGSTGANWLFSGVRA